MSLYDTDPNAARAEWANRAIDTFMLATGTGKEDSVSDLLCDLMHYCDQQGTDFIEELGRAKRHYDVESKEDKTT